MLCHHGPWKLTLCQCHCMPRGPLNCVSFRGTAVECSHSSDEDAARAQHGEASVNAGTQDATMMYCSLGFFPLGDDCPLLACHRQRASHKRKGRHSRSTVLYLIACRSPSKSITSHPANPHLGQAGKLERQGRMQYQNGRGTPRPPNQAGPRRWHRMSGA